MPTEPPQGAVAETEEVNGVQREPAENEPTADEPEPGSYHALLTLAGLQQCLALILFPAACAFQIYALVIFWPEDQPTSWHYVAIIITPFLWGWLLVLALSLSAFFRVVVDKGRRLRSLENKLGQE